MAKLGGEDGGTVARPEAVERSAKMTEPKGWTLVMTEEDNPLFGEVRTYTRDKLNLIVSGLPKVSQLQVSVSCDGRHPNDGDQQKVIASFPPGEWTNTACSSAAHHWLYEEGVGASVTEERHSDSSMTKDEIDALYRQLGKD